MTFSYSNSKTQVDFLHQTQALGENLIYVALQRLTQAQVGTSVFFEENRIGFPKLIFTEYRLNFKKTN